MPTRSDQWSNRLSKWLEPELFQPFVFGILISLTLSEFVRGALTLSLLPTYGKTVLGFAVEWTALALSIHYLVDNILRSPAGWLVDKIGQRFVLLLGFAIATLAVFLMMRVHTVSGLIMTAALYGIGVTPMWPAAISGIGEATPQKRRGSFMGYLYIFWLAGTGLGPVVINFVIGRTYKVAFWLLVAVDAAAFALAWLLVRQHPRREHGAEGAQGERQQWHVAEDANADAGAGAASTRPAAAHRHMDWPGMWRNIKSVAFLFPGMFAQTFAVASLIPILSLYAKVVLHISGTQYSLILVAGGACTVLLLIPAGKLVDRFGPRRCLVPAFLVAGAGLMLYPLHHTLPLTYVVVTVLGTAYAFILPAWNSVLDHSIDSDKKGTLWGVFMTIEGLGSAVGPYLGGLVWDVWSPEAPFFVSAGVILVMGILYIKLPLEARRTEAAGAGATPARDTQTHGARGSTDLASSTAPAVQRREARTHAPTVLNSSSSVSEDPVVRLINALRQRLSGKSRNR